MTASPELNADVSFTATAAGSTVTITMHVRLADLDQYAAPAGRYNTTVGIVSRDLRFVASYDDPRMMTADLRAAGWRVDPAFGWTNGVAVVTPATK